MSLVDMLIDTYGVSVTLHTVTMGAPDATYGQRSKADASASVKAIIGPWGVVRSYASGVTRPGQWTDSEMVAVMPSTTTATENSSWIDDGSDKYDVVEVTVVDLMGTTQYKLLKLERRQA